MTPQLHSLFALCLSRSFEHFCVSHRQASFLGPAPCFPHDLVSVGGAVWGCLIWQTLIDPESTLVIRSSLPAKNMDRFLAAGHHAWGRTTDPIHTLAPHLQLASFVSLVRRAGLLSPLPPSSDMTPGRNPRSVPWLLGNKEPSRVRVDPLPDAAWGSELSVLGAKGGRGGATAMRGPSSEATRSLVSFLFLALLSFFLFLRASPRTSTLYSLCSGSAPEAIANSHGPRERVWGLSGRSISRGSTGSDIKPQRDVWAASGLIHMYTRPHNPWYKGDFVHVLKLYLMVSSLSLSPANRA